MYSDISKQCANALFGLSPTHSVIYTIGWRQPAFLQKDCQIYPKNKNNPVYNQLTFQSQLRYIVHIYSSCNLGVEQQIISQVYFFFSLQSQISFFQLSRMDSADKGEQELHVIRLSGILLEQIAFRTMHLFGILTKRLNLKL